MTEGGLLRAREVIQAKKLSTGLYFSRGLRVPVAEGVPAQSRNCVPSSAEPALFSLV
jgi:hypothetical protein